MSPVKAVLPEAPVLDRLSNPPEERAVAVEVRARLVPVVRESLARVLIFPVAVVLVILVVPNPVKAILPEVPVRDKAPVVNVNPSEAVKVEENLPVPVTSRVVPGLVVPIPTLPSTESPLVGPAALA